MGKKKLFDHVMGNPPYQVEVEGDKSSYMKPIYNSFFDEACELSDDVCFIMPGRFLFDAGGTPSEWNKKMLDDEHLRVPYYESNSGAVFSNTDIKGGVAIVHHDEAQVYGAIQAFTPFVELRNIKQKVSAKWNGSLSEIITNRGIYKYSKLAYDEQPILKEKASDLRVAPSAFERMPELFVETKPDDGHEYIQLLGNIKGQRVYRFFRKDYLRPTTNLTAFKVLVPKANGSGSLGEVLTTPLIGEPLIGFTETYISIGEVDNRDEAEHILRYIKGKFARVMLGIKKVTQNNPRTTWEFVPLQDFTSNSDIDWSKSIPEIDKQLYKKYGLTKEEIDFIESHVKEMPK